ncbi:MAG: cupin domain-containing protein [Gammaproteobacteria bacterium]
MNNIFGSIPNDLDVELVEQLAHSQHARIERIVSKGHRSPATGWYDQDQNEWVIVLKGEATLLFSDDSQIRLKPGDYIDIPAHKKHRVQWTDPNIETIWLAVHY